MSKIAEFKALEAQLAEQLAQLDALKNDKQLKREIEFEEKVRALLNEYSYKLRDVIAILDPEVSRTPNSAGHRGHSQRRERVVKVFINPTPMSALKPRAAITLS